MFQFAFPQFLNKLWHNLYRRVDAFVDIPINPYCLAAYRICYALVSLPVVYGAFTLADFTGIERASGSAEGWYFAWFIALIMILLGWGSRLAAVACVFLVPMLFDSSIGSVLLRLGALWMACMRPDEVWVFWPWGKRVSRPTYAWPCYLLAINLLTLEFFAGISKTLDPFWRHGLGFYYTLIQPWLKPEFTNFLLDIAPFIFVFNYVAILFQLTGLPFFLFRRTRFMGVLVLICTYSFFSFPLRIDPIGPVGLVLTLPILGTVPGIQQWLNRLTPNVQTSAPTPKPVRILPWAHGIAVSALALLGYFSFYTVVMAYPAHLSYPLIEYPFQPAVKPHTPGFIRGMQANLTRFNRSTGLAALNQSTLNIDFWGPFCARHFLGRYYYWLDAQYDVQVERNILPVFNPNGTTNLEGRFFNQPSILKNRMWSVGMIAHKLSFDTHYRLSDQEDRLIRALFQTAQKQITPEKQKRLRTITLYVRPILLPNRYQGNVQPWLQQAEIALFRYDLAQQQYVLVSSPPRLDFSDFRPEYQSQIKFAPIQSDR